MGKLLFNIRHGNEGSVMHVEKKKRLFFQRTDMLTTPGSHDWQAFHANVMKQATAKSFSPRRDYCEE